ncbi:BnaC03g59710D [Brassica napus]|uniref:BnaC03g59710D protein n=1 Tax=Brassica napus TaxID=3708 RepID=A0A078FCH1_BRANA|nr:BnaC03g59710D [Brassica napus]
MARVHLFLKPSLPQIKDPKTVGEVEGYTKEFCPLKIFGKKDGADMKAKEAGILKTIASFAIGRVSEREEKQEAIETFKFMKSLAGRILGGRKKEEKETTTLTVEQLKEIKDGILKWQTVIVKVANTMVVSTTTNNEGSAGAPSTDTNNQSQGTTEGSSSPNSGSATGSPSNKPSAGSNPGAGTPSTDTNNQSQGTTNTASSRSATTSQTTEVTVTEVETQTSEQVMTFLMNLEKKCPPKEEYKQFFEKLKSTMAGSAKVSSPKKKGGLFAMIKGAVGKIGDAMQFIRSRIGNKSAEVKKSMETYQAEVIKNMEELNAIYAKILWVSFGKNSKIVTQNQSKKGGAMTCTPEQQAEIKTTITKWEQVTTQFVKVAIKSETSTATSTSTSSSTGTAQAN